MLGRMSEDRFEWDLAKDQANQAKHGIAFAEACAAFGDPMRVITDDTVHSSADEPRYFCIGKIARGIVSVRFTYRDGVIRIYGAGFWRAGRKKYEAENQIH